MQTHTHTDSTRVCVCAPARVWEWKRGEGSLAKLSSASLTSPPPPITLPLCSSLPSRCLISLLPLHAVHLIPASKLRVEFDGLCAVCEGSGGFSKFYPPFPLPLSLLMCYYYCICRMVHMCQMCAYPVTHTKLSIIGLGFNSSEREERVRNEVKLINIPFLCQPAFSHNNHGWR